MHGKTFTANIEHLLKCRLGRYLTYVITSLHIFCKIVELASFFFVQDSDPESGTGFHKSADLIKILDPQPGGANYKFEGWTQLPRVGPRSQGWDPDHMGGTPLPRVVKRKRQKNRLAETLEPHKQNIGAPKLVSRYQSHSLSPIQLSGCYQLVLEAETK